MTFSKMTLSITGIFATISIDDILFISHSAKQHKPHYAECRYTECRILFVVMLSVVAPFWVDRKASR